MAIGRWSEYVYSGPFLTSFHLAPPWSPSVILSVYFCLVSCLFPFSYHSYLTSILIVTSVTLPTSVNPILDGRLEQTKNIARTASWSSTGFANFHLELLPYANLKAQLQSSSGPMTCVKDAHAWLNTKGWIPAGGKYMKPKLTNILFTVASTQKLWCELCN